MAPQKRNEYNEAALVQRQESRVKYAEMLTHRITKSTEPNLTVPRHLNAFNVYVKHNFHSFRAQLSLDQRETTAVLAGLTKQWKALSPKDRQKYVDEARGSQDIHIAIAKLVDSDPLDTCITPYSNFCRRYMQKHGTEKRSGRGSILRAVSEKYHEMSLDERREYIRETNIMDPESQWKQSLVRYFGRDFVRKFQSELRTQLGTVEPEPVNEQRKYKKRKKCPLKGKSEYHAFLKMRFEQLGPLPPGDRFMNFKERIRTISTEWQQLKQSLKKPHQDQSATDEHDHRQASG